MSWNGVLSCNLAIAGNALDTQYMSYTTHSHAFKSLHLDHVLCMFKLYPWHLIIFGDIKAWPLRLTVISIKHPRVYINTTSHS